MNSDLLFSLTSHFLFSLVLGRQTQNLDCKEEGQFLANPDDHCSYFRCVAFMNDDDKPVLYKVHMLCATGTVTDIQNFQPQNACSQTVQAGTCPSTCQRLGQFLPGDDECHFKVCTYSTNSWRQILGSILEPVQQPCPMGTSLDRTKTFNEISPCNNRGDICAPTKIEEAEEKETEAEQ